MEQQFKAFYFYDAGRDLSPFHRLPESLVEALVGSQITGVERDSDQPECLFERRAFRAFEVKERAVGIEQEPLITLHR